MKKITLVLAFVLLSPLAAQAQDLAGVYAHCPRKDPGNCPEQVAAFREEFPIGQPGPFILLRKDGGGYMAPDDKRTISFTWEAEGGELQLFLQDQKKSKTRYAVQGPVLTELKSGEIYHLSLSDQELNPEPEAFKKTWQRQKQSGKQK